MGLGMDPADPRASGGGCIGIIIPAQPAVELRGCEIERELEHAVVVRGHHAAEARVGDAPVGERDGDRSRNLNDRARVLTGQRERDGLRDSVQGQGPRRPEGPLDAVRGIAPRSIGFVSVNIAVGYVLVSMMRPLNWASRRL